MEKRLLLIRPVNKKDIISHVDYLVFPPLNLGLIAALTPENYDITILDEEKQDLSDVLTKDFDLVGLTALTSTAPRAYEISEMFRKRGITTIMGGVHASVLPDEALRYADSLVIGEAEGIWSSIIEDFERNALKKIYNGGIPSLANLPMARRDLFKAKYLIGSTLLTARGCPWDCEFCSVTLFSGRYYRQRSIEEILDELEKIQDKKIVFVDDNIIGYGKQSEKRAIKLFKGMVDRSIKKIWASQAAVNMVDNEEVLKWASKSGARGFLIGFESLNLESLKEMRKGINIRYGKTDYFTVIKKLHDYGLGVVGSFIFGWDSDNKDTFDITVDFVWESGLDGVQYCALTPFPGTRLYTKLSKENRIFKKNYPKDWKEYNLFTPTFIPRNMSQEDLTEGIKKAYKNTNSLVPAIYRALKTLINTKRYIPSLHSFLFNYGEYKGLDSRVREIVI